MKADFSKLSVQMGFEGEPEVMDLRKELGNAIRRNTSDIGLDETARAIYFSDGAVDIPDGQADDILRIVQRCYVVPVQESVRAALSRDKLQSETHV